MAHHMVGPSDAMAQKYASPNLSYKTAKEKEINIKMRQEKENSASA